MSTELGRKMGEFNLLDLQSVVQVASAEGDEIRARLVIQCREVDCGRYKLIYAEFNPMVADILKGRYVVEYKGVKTWFDNKSEAIEYFKSLEVLVLYVQASE